MKVYLFKLIQNVGNTDLSGLLDNIISDPLDDRNRELGPDWMRIEKIEKNENLYLMDFIRLRLDSGPGKAGLTTSIEGFDLDEDEGFGEETACLYDPQSNYLIMQYNHFGLRHSAIAKYFSVYDENAPCEFHLRPRFVDDLDRQLSSKTIFRTLDLKIDTRFLNRGDRSADIPVSQALEFGLGKGADTVHIRIAVTGGRNRSLSDNVLRVIDWSRRAMGTSSSAIPKLQLTAKDNENAAFEVLDFISPRLVHEHKLEAGSDRRYSREDRWDALRRSRTNWRNIIVNGLCTESSNSHIRTSLD